jgi:hypothetical protein
MYMHRPFIFPVTPKNKTLEQVITFFKSHMAECLDRTTASCCSVDLG